MAFSVLLVDDTPAILNGLTGVVEATGIARVIATATNCAEALARANEHRPDLILLDVSLGCESGVDIATMLLADSTRRRILALSAHASSVYVRGMLKAGVNGYMLKDNVHDEISTAINAVMADEQWIGDGLQI